MAKYLKIRRWGGFTAILIVTAIILLGVASAILEEGQILYFPMGEGTGTTSIETYNDSLNLELFNITWMTDDLGYPAIAMLTNYSAAITLNETSVFNLTEFNGSTITFRMNLSVTAGDDGLAFKYNETDNNFSIKTFGSSNQIILSHNNVASPFTDYNQTPDEWHTYTIRYNDGVNASLFIDGAYNSTVTVVGTDLVSVFDKLAFGKSDPEGTSYWEGVMNKWAVWNRSLTDAEVLTWYNDIYNIPNYTQAVDKSSISEGDTAVFNLTVQFPSIPTTTAYLSYNGVLYAPTTSVSETNQYNFTRTLVIPQGIGLPTGNAIEWHWVFNVTGEYTNINTVSNSQSVVSTEIDNCTTYEYNILNYTLYDEDSLSLIDAEQYNATIETNVLLYSPNSDELYANYSGKFVNASSAAVCMSNLTTGSSYRMYVTTKYSADSYSVEYHNIQNYTLMPSNLNQNISIYDLLTSRATRFTVYFKDGTFLPVQGALIDITREYVSDGIFRSVEVGKTDADGKTSVSLVRNDETYTIVVSREGETLATFENVRAVCDDYTILNCKISLNQISPGAGIEDFATKYGLTYKMTLNPTTRTISTVFTVQGGGSATIKTNGTRYDRFLNESVCTDELTTSSGTLNCIVSDSYGNVTVLIELWKDGVSLGTTPFTLEDNPTEYFDGNNVIMALMMVMSIPLMFIGSTIGMVIGVMIGFIAAAMLMMTSGGSWWGLSGATIWLILAGGIIIWKISSGGRD